MRKLSGAKSGLSRLFNIRSSKNNECECYPHTCEDQDKRKQSDLLPEAYMLANNRMHEIDAEKAMALVLTRHERWKAGGPL